MLAGVVGETLLGVVIGAGASGGATYWFTVRQHERLARREAIRLAMAAVARQQARRSFVRHINVDGAEQLNPKLADEGARAWREAVEIARDALAALEPYDRDGELRPYYTKSHLDDQEDRAVQAILRRLYARSYFTGRK